MIEEYKLFSTPLFISQYTEFDINIVKDLFYDIEKTDTNPWDYCKGSYSSFNKEKSSQILELEQCNDLKKHINNLIANINERLGIPNNFFLKESWFTINRAHSFHGVHNHNPSLWSGVFYVTADENASAITFINDNLNTNWPYVGKISKPSELTSSGSTFKVQTNDLIIFPGWLKHKMEYHTADTERITIAFNYSNIG